jgi:phosphonopyruvate decarboxylase
MICPLEFVDMLRSRGIALATGVPCSYLTGLINTVISHPELQYVNATNEGDAVAIACGAALGHTPAAVMFQNSGLGNAVSPLTSLTATFRIPVLVVVTWRGEPGGPSDEPQHGLMGKITTELLDVMNIPWRLVSDEARDLPVILNEALEHLEAQSTPFALIVRKGIFGQPPMAEHARTAKLPRHSAPDWSNAFAEQDSAVVEHEADNVLRAAQTSLVENDALIATTGFTGRALYALEDRPNQFYMVGSMGCASSLGLGLAKAQPERKIVVLDGDGAFLMRMGAVAAVGCERPDNLIHILLDNGVHDSTGSQATVSPGLDPVAIARASGYPLAARINGLNELSAWLRQPAQHLTFLHVKTKPRSDRKLPRPHLSPVEVALRFREWMGESCLRTEVECGC